MYNIEYHDDERDGPYLDIFLKTSPKKIVRRYLLEHWEGEGEETLYVIWFIYGGSNQEVELEEFKPAKKNEAISNAITHIVAHLIEASKEQN